MWIATFRLHTASLLQAMGSTGYASPYEARCSAVIGWFSTAVIDAFRSSLFRRTVPSAVRSRTALLLLCFLIVGIHASGISIPLSLLMLLGLSLIGIASLTLHVYQWGSRSINFTSFQSGWCPVLWACSETGEVWVRANRMSRSCSACCILVTRENYFEMCLPFIRILEGRRRL